MSSGGEYIRCPIRPKGGRRAPKSTERKNAAADRIVDLIEKGRYGCRLATPARKLDYREREHIAELNWFNSLSKRQQLQHLSERLRKLRKAKADLYIRVNNSRSEQKRMVMRRKLREPIIDLQIAEVEKQIEEIK